MKTHYCSRCDEDGKLGGHRCFTARVRNPVIPRDKAPDKSKRTSERLLARLRKEGFELDESVELARCYVGHWQRSAGAWLWTVRGKNIGSCWTMKDCLTAKSWDVLNRDGATEIIPRND